MIRCSFIQGCCANKRAGARGSFPASVDRSARCCATPSRTAIPQPVGPCTPVARAAARISARPAAFRQRNGLCGRSDVACHAQHALGNNQFAALPVRESPRRFRLMASTSPSFRSRCKCLCCTRSDMSRRDVLGRFGNRLGCHDHEPACSGWSVRDESRILPSATELAKRSSLMTKESSCMRFGTVSSARRADTGHLIRVPALYGHACTPGQPCARLFISVRLGFLTHSQGVINCDLCLPWRPVLWAAVSRGTGSHLAKLLMMSLLREAGGDATSIQGRSSGTAAA